MSPVLAGRFLTTGPPEKSQGDFFEEDIELWCWRRMLRIPWTARRLNQSILKEINPDYPLEGLVLKLKRHYFGHLMGQVNSLEKTLMLGKVFPGGSGGREYACNAGDPGLIPESRRPPGEGHSSNLKKEFELTGNKH